jgi:hypothetical protein
MAAISKNELTRCPHAPGDGAKRSMAALAPVFRRQTVHTPVFDETE